MKKTDHPTLEAQVEDLISRVNVTNRINELKAHGETIQKEVNQAQQFIQQKITEGNMVAGAISELEKLLAPAQPKS